MKQIDLMTKFNRGLILALVEKNIFEAVQTYRQYIQYLKTGGYDEELKLTKEVFMKKLLDFVEDKKNEDKLDMLIPAYQELINEYPDDYKFLFDCSKCFNKLKQEDIELELLELAEKKAPSNLDIKKDILEILKKKEKGFEMLKRAEFILEKEKLPNNYCLLSVANNLIYDVNNDFEYFKKAVSNMENAYNLDKSEKLFLKNLIVLYTKGKYDDKLKKAWEKYLEFQNNWNNEDYFDYGAYLIRNGNLKEGFKHYEKRFFHEKRPVKYPIKNKPFYKGEIIKDKTLLVHYEQGLGDIFLFSRFLFNLKERAGKIILRMPKTVLEILKRSFPFCEVSDLKEKLPEFDYHLPLMSAPYVLGIDKDSLGVKKGYLFSNKEKTEKFKKEIFNTDKFKIGISYKGNIVGLQTRNIPVEEFKALLDIDKVQLYSLQFEEKEVPSGIINLAPYIKDFDDTSSLIENMDLIVSIDNSVMNLAGAMGKKVFCLFNSLPEYRWFDLTGDDVKWYETVKPFICDKQNNWAPVIEKVKFEIQGML